MSAWLAGRIGAASVKDKISESIEEDLEQTEPPGRLSLKVPDRIWRDIMPQPLGSNADLGGPDTSATAVTLERDSCH